MPVISTIAAATARAFGAFKSAAGGAADEFFDYVTLLLHGDGTNGAQNNTFLDSSTNNFTITRNGNTTQGTFSPFSQTGWSNYFDGSSILTFASSTNYVPGAGEFCLECWFMPTGSGDNWLIGNRNGNFVPFGINYAANTYPGSLLFYVSSNGSSWNVVNGVTVAGVAANQWNHFALVRNSSNQFIAYINGTGTTIATSSANFSTAQPFYVGGSPSGPDSDFIGYISNVRFVKGSSVYSGNFTPSTSPLTAITNTQLLTSQSNRFVDNSANAVTPTITGTPSVQAFSPFAPTAAYSAATVGGSGYFDGSGDYITTATSASFTLAGTSDWQIDFWYYPLAFPAQFSGPFGGTNSDGIFFSNRGGALDFTNGNDNAGLISSPFPPLNAWNHIVLVNRGSTNQRSVFINGVRTGTITNSYTFINDAFYITTYPASTAKGYISNFRVQNGARDYDPASITLTVPSTPRTATASTVLLLNFTNAGIIDNTAKNVLETVGNAQISTSVKKYGTGSLAFDGSGDDLRVIDNAGLVSNFGTGAFTVEFWIYANSWGAFNNIIDFRKSTDYMLLIYKSGGLYYYNDGADRITGSSLATSTWHHIALTRSGTSTKLFINGTQSGSTYTDSTNYPSQGVITIGGRNDDAGNPFNGYIDDLRITKGIARYTTTFTPPTEAFPDL